MGFFHLWGTGDAIYSKADMEVYGFIPRITLPLRKDWKKWDLEFEGNFFTMTSTRCMISIFSAQQ